MSGPYPWPFPREDRDLSPYTGWTRMHWEATADGMLAVVRPYASPGRGLIQLPGRHSSSGERSDGLEGYARTFLLAAFRVAGAGGDDPGGLLQSYADGLAAGTLTPGKDDDESWPRPAECGKAWVEAASVALGLRLTKPWLWDRLDDGVRQRAADWLSSALGEPPVNNNWWLFPLTVGGFLAEAGVRPEDSRAAIERGLERIEQWYAGQGWYTDGPERSFDHYNGWALHLYPLLHAHLSGDADLLSRYGGRLRAFLDGYARLFDANGAPIHQGRSLTYRFAATSALWAGALTGHTPLRPGVSRRIAGGSLRYFLDRGAAAGDGLLSLGWHSPYERGIVQGYSGTASPYWASKGFVALLLPPDHPEWTATEQPGPAETADAVTALPAPGWLVQSTAADGLVRLHNHGSHGQVLPPDHDDPLYARLAYSTRTGPTEPRAVPDNHFGLLVEAADAGDKPRLTRRGPITPLGSGPGWAASAHRPLIGDQHLPGVTITSVTLAHGATEVRIHRVFGAEYGTRTRQSGWAADTAVISELVPVHGFGADAESVDAGGTAYGARARMPVLDGTVDDGLFVCLARLSGEPTLSGPLTADVHVRDAQGDAQEVRIAWPDGTAWRVALGRDTVAVRPGSRAVLDVILRHQHPSGGYPACPAFEVYGYSWFRDGAFIAEGADRAGAADSARAFHDWCARAVVERADRIEAVVRTVRAGGTPAEADWLPARYTLEGADEGDTGWWNFQLDGYGTWLWFLVEHLRRRSADPAPFREAARLTCEYLAAAWRTTCYDWWEEDPERQHGATLAAIEAGLRAAVGAGLVDGVTAQRARGAVEEIAETVRREGVRDRHLTKWLGGEGEWGSSEVDASLLAALTPFGLVSGELAETTLAAIERDLLYDGGVYRYRADTFYGGSRWPVLSALLGWHYARTGRRAEAVRLLRWIEAQFSADGLLPEQAPAGPRLAPEREQEWLDRWGPNATPLLWSHGMYLILADELGEL